MGRLDVFGILSDGTRVDIEMQVINHMNMEKRSLFYWAHMYLHFDALRIGAEYGTLKPAIAINIVRFCFLPQEDPHSRYVIFNPETGHQLSDDMELHFLEIPKYRKKTVAKMNRIERWLAYFADTLSEHEKEEMKMAAPAVSEAIQATGTFLMDEAAYQNYLARESAIWDYNTDVRENRRRAREEGHAEGLIEGRAEGRAKGLIEGEHHAALRIARMMLAAHKNVAEIEQLCSLSRDEILALQKNDSSM